MLRKAFLILSASALLGPPVTAPNAALAFGPPPPPPAFAGPPPRLAGPPPGLGFGGPPPHPGLGGFPSRVGAGGPPSRLGAPAGFRGGDRGIPSNVRGVQGRSAAYAYGRSGRYGQGYGLWRDRYWRGYGVYVSGNDGHAYANDGCYYTYSYRRQMRVLVCSEN